MRELTFVINPFTEVESERVVYVGEDLEYEKKRDILNHQSYDYVSYTIGGEEGLFTVNDFFFQNPNQRVFGFNCVNYHYILGDKSIFTIETEKSPKEMLEKLKSLLLFFSDESINRFVFNGIKRNWSNKVVYQPFSTQPFKFVS